MDPSLNNLEEFSIVEDNGYTSNNNPNLLNEEMQP